MRGDAPVGDQFWRVEAVEAEDCVGIADVDGEQHGQLLPSRHAAGEYGADALCGADAEKAAAVEAICHAGECIRFGDDRRIFPGPRWSSQPGGCGCLRLRIRSGTGRSEAFDLCLEMTQESDQEILTRPVLAGLDFERGGERCQLRRERGLMHVEADADDGVAHACDFCVQFRKDAAHLAAGEEQIVGPADVWGERGDVAHSGLHGEAGGE